MNTPNFQELHWLLDMIQNTDIGIVVLDKNYDIEIFNSFMQVHSNIGPDKAIGANVFDLFPYLDDGWFRRRVKSVIELGIPVYTTWEQRDNVFDFELELPIHYETKYMYQNATLLPLRSACGEDENVGIVIYDVTDTAVNRVKLEAAKDDLLRLSRTDKLTGLWNRGYWEERLVEEYKRCLRSNNSASLVMFDIDHFKNINDTYGHQVGDDAIRMVAEIMRQSSRDVDISGRYGGEEFTCLLPDTCIDGAAMFAERLRVNIEESVVKSQGQSVKFTISLGVAGFNEEFEDATQWLVSADKALYSSKENGRNQTNIYGAGKV